MIKAAAVATLLLNTAAVASEDIAAQLDIIAPLIAANGLAQLGGPDHAAGLLETIDGRWFTLNVAARNWDRNDDKPGTVASSIARLCADDWENIVTMQATGPASFLIEQRTPDGEDNGTMEMTSSDPTGRHFTSMVAREEIIAAYNLENADAMRQDAMVEEVQQLMASGAELWMPSPDLMVNVTADETEVWGRCPS